MAKIPDDTELDKFDGRNLLKECATIVNNKYYQSFKPGIEDLVRFSKSKSYHRPDKHLAVQWGILTALEEIEAVISKGKEEIRKMGAEDVATQRRRNIFLGKAYREIGDGIAWRTLGYSRFQTRILSQGRHAGHTWGKDGRNAELRKAVAAVSNGNHVLINDATACLRVGDLIAVRPDGSLSIAEVKKKKKDPITAYSIVAKRKKGQAINKQEQRLVHAQYAIDTKQFPHNGTQVPVEEIIHDIPDFMSEVGGVLRQACRHGISGKLVAPYMYVEAIDVTKLMDAKDFEAKLARNAKKRPGSEVMISHSNYDKLMISFHDEVTRSVPPYTVFPFSTKLITKLIIGELFLTLTIYKQPLVDAFKALGWELQIHEDKLDGYKAITDEENVRYFSSEQLFPAELIDTNELMTLWHPEGFKLQIFGHIAAMAQEFISAEYITSFAEAVMANSTPGVSRGVYPDSTSDRKRWD